MPAVCMPAQEPNNRQKSNTVRHRDHPSDEAAAAAAVAVESEVVVVATVAPVLVHPSHCMLKPKPAKHIKVVSSTYSTEKREPLELFLRCRLLRFKAQREQKCSMIQV